MPIAEIWLRNRSHLSHSLATEILCHLIWHNNHSYDKRLRQVIAGANAPGAALEIGLMNLLTSVVLATTLDISIPRSLGRLNGMTTPSPAASVALLDGQALDQAIAGLETDAESSALWDNLTSSGYSPQMESAAGARITLQSPESGYTYLSLSFISAEGTAARLVWDNLRGQSRTCYGVTTLQGDNPAQVDVHEVVNGQVTHTYTLARQPNRDVNVMDATGHVIQVVPFGSMTPPVGEAALAEAASTGCTFCQWLVTILADIIDCGSVFNYLLCNFVCDTATLGVDVALCNIICNVYVGLVCLATGIILNELVCYPYCG
jgi:hypothetical protein